MLIVHKLFHDEAGFIISAELVLVATLLVIGMIVGLSEVQHAVVAELNDVADAVGSMNQSYYVSGFSKKDFCAVHARTAGSAFYDSVDECDNNQCDLACDIAVPEGPKGHHGGHWHGGWHGGTFGGGAVGGAIVSGGAVAGAICEGAAVVESTAVGPVCPTDPYAPGVPSPATQIPVPVLPSMEAPACETAPVAVPCPTAQPLPPVSDCPLPVPACPPANLKAVW